MADTFTHGAATGWTAKGIGVVYFTTYDEILLDPLWLTVAVLGATLPDILSEPLIWIERHRRFGKQRPWYISLQYNFLLTEELEMLEAENAWQLNLWHWWHSYWSMLLVATLIGVLFGSHLSLAWIIGHGLHIMLDEHMHRKMFALWPLPYNTSRATRNWWEWGWWCYVYPVSVPAAFAGIYHLFQLHGVTS